MTNNNHLVHLARSSSDENWFTPEVFIRSARKVFGGDIDTDPASSIIANEIVQARVFYTVEDNGLLQNWMGNVWLNPPYTRGVINRFMEKLKYEFETTGHTQQFITLTNNTTDSKWFATLASISAAMVFPSFRISYWNLHRTKNKPLQGQVFCYGGHNVFGFLHEFAQYGTALVRYYS